MWLACLDAESGALWEFRDGGFVPHPPERALAVVAGESAAWYQGKRGFLPPVAFAVVAATGNIYDGLWYPIIIAVMTLVIGTLFLRETKDNDINA